MTDKINVDLISESTFSVRGHGVHTAFQEMHDSLAMQPDINLRVNRLTGLRRNGIIHIHTVGPFSLLAVILNRGHTVITAHVIPDSFIGSFAGAKYWYGWSVAYLRFFYNRADAIVAVSEEVATALHDQLGVKPPVTVIPNAINTAHYHMTAHERGAYRDKLGIKPDEVVVLSVGQIQPRKRFDVFVDLATRHPEQRYIWVGGIPFKKLGADASQMEAMIQTAPPNLKVTGVIELSEVKAYYGVADIFILPSDQENHPLAILEAAAASLPIIIRDITEYDSSFGDLLLRGDNSSFDSIIERLLKDPAYRKQAIAGSTKVAKRYSIERTMPRFIKIYRNLIG